MNFNRIQKERDLLGVNCLTGTCCGKIYEIVWVDKFGIETPNKYVLTRLEKSRVGNRKKVKTKKPTKIVRSLSETSGSSIEEKASRKIIHEPQTRTRSEKTVANIKIPFERMNIRSCSKSYASTVRNNHTHDSCKE